MPLSLFTSIGKYGVASVIAVYLAWQMASSLPIIEKDIISVKAAQETLKVDHTEIRQKTEAQGEMTMRLLRGICLNSAQTREEKERCNP